MRSSKKYQEIADSLNTVYKSLGLMKSISRSDNPEDFIFAKVVDQFCYDFKRTNPKFKPEYFRNEVYKN
jgi:hypothetical protein